MLDLSTGTLQQAFPFLIYIGLRFFNHPLIAFLETYGGICPEAGESLPPAAFSSVYRSAPYSLLYFVKGPDTGIHCQLGDLRQLGHG
jgi:hypothetical protein